MFKNAFKNLSSGISNISSSISNKLTSVFSKTKSDVNNIISTDTPAANDNIFDKKTSQTVNIVNKSTDNIIDTDEEINYKVLGDFSGTKILTIKNQKFKLIFNDGEIQKALKDVKGKYIHVNAKAIRQLTQILQKKSTDVNRISYGVKRNVQNIYKKQELETSPSDNKEAKLNGSRKHNNAILEKQKREKIQAEKIKQEQHRIEKESHMQQDYKILFRYQSVLSKCNTQGDIMNGSQNIAEVVLKTLAARKGITLNNFQKFLNNQKNFQVLKKVLSDYLTIDFSYSAIGKSNRDSLYKILMKSCEIYNAYLYKNQKNDENIKQFYNSLDSNVWSVNNLLKKEKSLKEYENLISILFNNFSYKKYSCKDIFGDISVFEIAIKDLQENESLNSIQSDTGKKASDNIQQFIQILSEKYKNKLDNDVIIHNNKYYKKQLEISNRKKLNTKTYKGQFTQKVS